MLTASQLATIAIAAVATILTRALPFFAFPPNRPVPAYISYLGHALPGAVFGLLVVYCLKDVSIFTTSHGLPEAAGIAVVAATFLWKRNMLVSIFAGTAVYMLLVNCMFVA